MTSQQPPTANRVPSERTHHGDTVIDEYAWLADRENPQTIAYLEAENAYTQAATEHLAPLRDTLFNEIRSRTQETDLSVPTRMGDYWYYTRTQEGKQYGIHCRQPVRPGEVDPPSVDPVGDGQATDPAEEVLLDDNLLAEGNEFFALGTFDVSPDGRLLAYSVDTTGDERFTLKVKDLVAGRVLDDEVAEVSYGSAWSADGSTLFYMTVDEAWRPNRVLRHLIGTPATTDAVVFEEPDERFWVGVGLTRSQRYVLIESASKVTSEVLAIPADAPASEPQMVIPRRQGVEYSVEHQVATATTEDRFLILHNDGAEDFTLATTPTANPGELTPLIAHRPGMRLLDIDAFAGHLVLSLRREGLTALRVIPTDGSPEYDIDFPEPLYTVGAGGNPEYRTSSFRLGYTSLITPGSVYDCDLGTGELTLRKRTPVLGDFDPQRYEQTRNWATSADGTKIPISIVRRRTDEPGPHPCVLYGYGSYEASMDPWFSIARLSLLDRGVTFAVAHIRGGGEMGRGWYEQGKMLTKTNTFTDFVACASYLVEQGITTADQLVARGGSAGGLLMGAVANLAPERFGGIVAEVPFVDPLTSILDPSAPLTVIEWEEWGNPLADPEVYRYMKAYSPYENIDDRAYPPILAMSGLNDTRVLYHEPTKWVARLRASAPRAEVLLKTEMGAGHGGPSGRYDAWHEEAFVLAWILDRFGLGTAG